MPIDTVEIGQHKNVNYDISNPKAGRAVIYECVDCGLDVSHEEILEHAPCDTAHSISALERAWATNNRQNVEKQCASCNKPFEQGETVQVIIANNVTRNSWPLTQTCCNECDPLEMEATEQALLDIQNFVWFSGTITDTDEYIVSLNQSSGWFIPFESIVKSEKNEA